jgi:hypothetical protein
MRQENKQHEQDINDKRTQWTNDKEARKTGGKDEILEWTYQLH